MIHTPTNWDARFIEEAYRAREWSTCIRRQVGARLVKRKRVIGTGYNGAVRGARHCSEVGCIRERDGIASGKRLEHCRGAHAEAMALLGVPLWETQGSTLYTTTMPCPFCATLIVNVGVVKLFYCEGYHGLGRDILTSGGVEIVHWKGEEPTKWKSSSATQEQCST